MNKELKQILGTLAVIMQSFEQGCDTDENGASYLKRGDSSVYLILFGSMIAILGVLECLEFSDETTVKARDVARLLATQLGRPDPFPS